ncbi:MAG: hypothetical protein ATN31_02035 [Candidatus Epulonipiscioides saccharophilum]|nr:MAG: hypothetical protein ATN31_02035 [Epulopiscium sp. AS2M-Bin001]
MKLFKIAIATCLTLGLFTGCGSEESKPVESKDIPVATAETVSEQTTSTTPETPAEPEEPVRDLGGMEIILGAWGDQLEPEEKKSAQEEATWEYRHDIMEKYNFTFAQKSVGAWDELLELLSTSTMAGQPAAELFRIHANFIGAARDSGLLYDLATLDSFDLTDPKWSQPLIETMTVGDSVYAVCTFGRPSKVIFFNKRLFEESGLDPELLYDLQASGEWTWDTFLDVCEKLTHDRDNDGVYDTQAMIMNQSVFAGAAVFSNGGNYVDKDETGKYVLNLESPETLEALNWVVDFWATDYDIRPSHWNGHKEMFYAGQGAMYLGGEWECTTLTPELMTDDWGMVAFPKGPSADGYMAVFSDDAFVIPASFTKEEAENIAFAYDLWTTPTPGYDDPDAWKTSLYPLYRDERAIEETITMLREPGVGISDYASLIAGNIKTGTLIEDIYWGKVSIIESIEGQKGIWQAELDKMNAAMEAAVSAQ